MIKVATVTVTIAPNCHITREHPSGVRELSKVYSGGDALQVDAQTAADLYAAGLVLHPETGEAPPPLKAQELSYHDLLCLGARANGQTGATASGVMVSYGGSPMRAPADGEAIDASGGIPPEPLLSTEDRAPLPPPHDCTGGGLTYQEMQARAQNSGRVFAGSVVIEQADSRPWPSW